MSQNLGAFEELILLVVIMMKEDAYGQNIYNFLNSDLKRKTTLAAIHVVLTRLHSKNMLIKRKSQSRKVKGGRHRVLYTITSDGLNIVKRNRELRQFIYNRIDQSSDLKE